MKTLNGGSIVETWFVIVKVDFFKMIISLPPLHNAYLLFRQAVQPVHQRVYLRLQRRGVGLRVGAFGGEDAGDEGDDGLR